MKLEKIAEELTRDFLETIKPLNDSVELMTEIANQMGKAKELQETLNFVNSNKKQLEYYTGPELVRVVNDMGVQARSIKDDLEKINEAAL